MKNPIKIKQLIHNPLRALSRGAFPLLAFITISSVFGYDRYNDGCMDCHGHFKDDTTTKESVFPEDDKHEMHRGDDYMATACDLCHTNGDGRDPFIGSSNGTVDGELGNEGLGCTGCHVAVGLRAHHAANNVADCADCHDDDPAPLPENVKPPYYGTDDTKADNPCNDVLAAGINENWTIGDFVGLDNDGDNLYDLADFDCGPPYEIVTLVKEGDDMRIIWVTVGGRRDMLQATSDLSAPFTDVGSAIDVPGVGVVTESTVEVNGATNSKRFFRIKPVPLVP